ncbi:MAG: DUF262 domain-containing protein [Lachnospiraceae bacterium]|nr:DUF262 domain-containing protein [Lachnospiraceae bacterium]
MATTLHTLMDIFGSEFHSEGEECQKNSGDGITLEKIIIPMVQRDYAQGRESAEVEKVRSRFLDALRQAVSDSPITLDLIYGDIDAKGTMTPLDGQQRLTTLFLLHWYAAKKEGAAEKDYHFLNNFSYATRYSARDFCHRLIAFQPAFDKKLSEEIKDQSWFPLDWLNDPTIHAMLVMLDDIDEKFADIDHIWESLKDRAITFYFLPIKDMGLTDDLYIKMNSRGKPLTTFENFKAELENELRQKDNKLAEDMIGRIDRDWTDMLWEYRGENHTTDDKFLRYFQFVCDIICYQEGDTPQGKENDTFSLLSRYFSHDNMKLENHVKRLTDYFGCWCGLEDYDSLHDFFVSFISHEHEQGKIRWDNRYEIDIFEDCLCNYGEIGGNGNRAFSLGRVVLLYAVVTYLLHTDEVLYTDFVRRIRIVNNLVQNSDYEISDSENRVGGNRMPMILKQVDTIILQGKIDTKLERNFNVIQLSEETEKLNWTSNNPDMAELLFALEDHSLLYGQIGVIGLENTDCFSKFESLFECDYDAVDCALLVTGNYLQKDNDWRYQTGSAMGRGMAWRNLFHRSRNAEGFENTKKYLVQLLSEYDQFTDGILWQIVEDYIAECERKNLYDWRYYYVKYDKFRPGRYGKCRWWDFENKPYEMAVMWSERYPSAKTYQPFLKEVDQDGSLDPEDQGMSLYWDDGSWTVCENDAFVTYWYDEKSEQTVEIVEERIDIKQNGDGIDIENRIEKYRKLCWEEL